MSISPDAPIAIIGAGTMGVGIAQVAAIAGHCVTIIDTSAAALERGRDGLEDRLAKAVEKGRLKQSDRDELTSRIHWSTDIGDAAPVALVIEAILEELAVKRDLFAVLDGVVRPKALLASNTSSLGIGAIAEAVAQSGRVLGLHFFNPVPAMRLVEVVAGRESDPQAIDAAVALMSAWGKQPVRVRDVPGFIVNRVARPFYAEAFAALDDGIDPVTIDTALSESGGFRMGPLTLTDMIGHDVNYAVALSVFEAGVGTSRFRPQSTQRRLVEEGALGRKTGRGIYDYSRPLPVPNYCDQNQTPKRLGVSDAGLLGPLVEATRDAGVDVTRDEGIAPETIVVDGTQIALGDGRTLPQRPGVDVLFDHTRDFGKAATIVMSASGPNHVAAAAGFLRLAGRKALLVPDRPGQLVLRTLAQLANAAADAVTDRVATAADVDQAMQFGANHPESPLSWVERIGSDRIASALANMAEATGDTLYEPSVLFSGR